jgi:hypothetical protein
MAFGSSTKDQSNFKPPKVRHLKIDIDLISPKSRVFALSTYLVTMHSVWNWTVHAYDAHTMKELKMLSVLHCC